MNTQQLEIAFLEKGINAKKVNRTLQDILDLGYLSILKRLNGDIDFSSNEIKKIIDFLELDAEQIKNIFFSK